MESTSTLVYNPRVQAHIQITDKQGNTQILDLSEDLVAGSLSIRSNALHTFQFQLQNTQRKYDGLIRPMDKIVVTMTRIGAPARVFSGYMNNGPVFSVWPRVLSLSATCTLKRLGYWSWDSTSPAASTLLSEWNTTNATGASGTAPSMGGQVSLADGGLRDLVIDLLSKVCNWPKGQIHVGMIPPAWFQFAQAIGDEITAAADESSLIGTLGGSLSGTVGGSASVGGTSISAGVQLPAGVYGGETLNATQAQNASTIYAVAASKNLTAHDASMGIGCAMQESSLINLNHGDRDSVGLFQQRPSQGWGTAAQCEDPTYAATQFYNHLVNVPNYETIPYTQAIQAVQRSGTPTAYAKWQTMSDAVVAKLQSLNVNSSNAQNLLGTNGNSGVGMAAPSGATGRNVAAYGYNLITSRAANPIHYTYGGDSPDTTAAAQVQSLDCSSFVQWAYYHASNTHLVRTAAQQQAACTHTFPASVGQFVKGAVLFSEPGHIELSLGNGYTAAAHSSSFPLGEFGQCQVSIAYNGPSFTTAGLLPGIDYTDAATTQAAADALTQLTGSQHTVSNPAEFPGDGSGTTQPGAAGSASGGGTGTDSAASVFNALINVYTWGYLPSVEGQILAGPRALMNDDPILPFVANLMQASMRSWCSAPNGDFMAWFPDYFDIWNFAGKMVIQPIELMDFTVDWSDTDIVTHQYVIGSIPGMGTVVDQSSGNLTSSATSSNSGLLLELTSQGIATMDFPQIFRAIFGQDATQDFLDEYLNRFGARPDIQQVPSIQQGRPEFFLALYLFMQHWANQFTATIPVTFMPELWPGMVAQIPAFSFQAYVVNVTHSFAYGPNGSFTTNIDVCAPARIGDTDKMSVFGMLPVGGKSYLGTPTGQNPTVPTTSPLVTPSGHGLLSPQTQ